MHSNMINNKEIKNNDNSKAAKFFILVWFTVYTTNSECRLYEWPSSLITSQLQNLKSKKSWVISDEDPREDVHF